MAGPITAPEGSLGLSAMSAAILGRPVNKAVQTSAWRQRPLSPLDAHVSVQMFSRIQQHIMPAELQEVLRQAT